MASLNSSPCQKKKIGKERDTKLGWPIRTPWGPELTPPFLGEGREGRGGEGQHEKERHRAGLWEQPEAPPKKQSPLPQLASRSECERLPSAEAQPVPTTTSGKGSDALCPKGT